MAACSVWSLTFLQIDDMPIKNSTQQSVPIKPAQQGADSKAQYAEIPVSEEDRRKHKEMDKEVRSVYIYM